MTDVARIAQAAVAATQDPHQQHQVPQASHMPPSVAAGVFTYLHGAYGNQFAAKFATGQLDSSGRDKGTKAAMLVWGQELAKFPADVVRTAVERMVRESPEFPPNLPGLLAVCRAIEPRKAYVETHDLPPLLPSPAPVAVEFERVGDGRDWARQLLARKNAGQPISRYQLKCACDALRIPVPGIRETAEAERTSA